MLDAGCTISFNCSWVLANYHSSMAIDNEDDGGCFYDTHDFVLIAKPSGICWRMLAIASDFGLWRAVHATLQVAEDARHAAHLAAQGAWRPANHPSGWRPDEDNAAHRLG